MSVYYEIKEHLVVRNRTEEVLNDLEDVRNLAVGNLQSRMAVLGALMLCDEARVFDLTLTADKQTYTFSGDAPSPALKEAMIAMEGAKNLEAVFHYEFVWKSSWELYDMAKPFSMLDVIKDPSGKEMEDVFYSLWNKADGCEGEGAVTAYGAKDGKYYTGSEMFVEATTLPEGNWYADTDACVSYEGQMEAETVEKVLSIVERLKDLADINEYTDNDYREFMLNDVRLNGANDVKKLCEAYRELKALPKVECNLIGEYADTTGADVQRMNIEFDENGELKITVVRV